MSSHQKEPKKPADYHYGLKYESFLEWMKMPDGPNLSPFNDPKNLSVKDINSVLQHLERFGLDSKYRRDLENSCPLAKETPAPKKNKNGTAIIQAAISLAAGITPIALPWPRSFLFGGTPPDNQIGKCVSTGISYYLLLITAVLAAAGANKIFCAINNCHPYMGDSGRQTENFQVPMTRLETIRESVEIKSALDKRLRDHRSYSGNYKKWMEALGSSRPVPPPG